MATRDADLWHQVHAQREDGVPAMFLIRDVDPRTDQPQIFVVELPYAVTDLSKLPDATGYRRLDAFQDEWIEPACEALGWTFVAWKSEDGSFFFYLYGAGDPNTLLEKLEPFDPSLKFFNDRDAEWSEYAALRELVDQADTATDEVSNGHRHIHVHTADCGHDHEYAPDRDDAIDPSAFDDAEATSDGRPPARRPSTRAETVREPIFAHRAGSNSDDDDNDDDKHHSDGIPAQLFASQRNKKSPDITVPMKKVVAPPAKPEPSRSRSKPTRKLTAKPAAKPPAKPAKKAAKPAKPSKKPAAKKPAKPAKKAGKPAAKRR